MQVQALHHIDCLLTVNKQLPEYREIIQRSVTYWDSNFGLSRYGSTLTIISHTIQKLYVSTNNTNLTLQLLIQTCITFWYIPFTGAPVLCDGVFEWWWSYVSHTVLTQIWCPKSKVCWSLLLKWTCNVLKGRVRLKFVCLTSN